MNTVQMWLKCRFSRYSCSNFKFQLDNSEISFRIKRSRVDKNPILVHFAIIIIF